MNHPKKYYARLLCIMVNVQYFAQFSELNLNLNKIKCLFSVTFSYLNRALIFITDGMITYTYTRQYKTYFCVYVYLHVYCDKFAF